MTDVDPSEDGALATYRMPEGTAKREWTLTLFADRLRFEAEDRPPQEVHRSEVPHWLEFASPTFGAVLVVLIRPDKKRVVFRPPPDVLAALNEWLGPPSREELKAILSKIIAETGASSPADMGKVMGVATKQLAGQAGAAAQGAGAILMGRRR